MIRKIRNILHTKEQNHQNGHFDQQSHANNQTKSNSGSPVSYIKKKIRSTKSWVKIPKPSKLFQEEESAYESVHSLEPANQEFESYRRASHNSPSLKHSTLNSKKFNSSNNSKTDSECTYESKIHCKIFDKLSKSSIDSPANIPILCITSFTSNNPKWLQLSTKFNSCGLNVRLIELQKGVPVNALFYLSNLDLIYVKTADDLHGYVPRDCCKPITANSNESTVNSNLSSSNSSSCSTSSASNNLKPMFIQTNPEFSKFKPIESDTLNTNLNNYSTDDKSNVNDSIKYHSLSIESEYDDLIESNEEFTNSKQNYRRNQECFVYDSSVHSFLDQNTQQAIDYSVYKYRDSGYRSEIENNMTNFSVNNYRVLDDFEENQVNSPEKSPKNTNKNLISMQSRSRLPISIRSNLNLTLMDEQPSQGPQDPNVYCNITYKSPFINQGNLRMSARNISPKFQRNNIRRSLDSYLTHGTTNENNSRLQSFYAVSIELDENKQKNKLSQPDSMYPDLDVNRIEMDSMGNEAQSLNNKQEKIWTIILKHEARNFQEINVTPGMLVLVIKEFSDLLYVKIIGYENSSLNLSQQYGIIPRSCAVDLQEIIFNSNKSLSNVEKPCRRKSQITAL